MEFKFGSVGEGIFTIFFFLLIIISLFFSWYNHVFIEKINPNVRLPYYKFFWDRIAKFALILFAINILIGVSTHIIYGESVVNAKLNDPDEALFRIWGNLTIFMGFLVGFNVFLIFSFMIIKSILSLPILKKYLLFGIAILLLYLTFLSLIIFKK